MKKYWIICCLLLLSISFFAQEQTTKGKRFWVSFMLGNPEEDAFSLIFSTKNACAIKIENTNTGWEHNFSLPANSSDTVKVPKQQAMTHNYGQYLNRALLITSTDTISAYAYNYGSTSSDIARIIPEEMLADEYMVQTYTNIFVGNVDSQFLIIGTEDNTIVDITPSDTIYNHSANVTFPILLNKGKCYMHYTTNKGLSGTHIKARDCKKIAVFNGNAMTYIPEGEHAADHIFEQALPLHMWGKEFIVVNSLDRPADRVKITAAYDDTDVWINGNLAISLNARESHEFEINDSDISYYLNTSEPCMVYQYLVGFNYADRITGVKKEMGDPSLTIVHPLDQKVNNISFGTFNKGITTAHKLTVIAETSDVPNVMLDNNSIAASFSPVKGKSDYSYARINMNEGHHELKSRKGFLALAYGYGYAESYLYPPGSSKPEVSTEVLINKIPLKSLPVGNSYCANDVLTFNSIINYYSQWLTWEFGDGTKITGDSAKHSFGTKGTHEVKLIIDVPYLTCTKGSPDTLKFNVNIDDNKYVFHKDSICDNEKYPFKGEQLDSTGIYKDTITSPSGCATIYTLDLTVFPTYHITHKDTVLLGEGYKKHGFDLPEQYATGSFNHHLTSRTVANNCDSIAILILEVREKASGFAVQLKELDEICADQKSFPVSFNVTEGKVISYSLDFEQKALNRNFKNSTRQPINPNNSIEIVLPEKVVPDSYQVLIRFEDDQGKFITLPLEFTVMYTAGIITQRWNDILAVKSYDYNGEFFFSHYQWIKDNTEIQGETEAYLYVPEELDMHAEYRVKLTRASDGVTLESCPFIPVRLISDLTLKVYPTAINRNEMMTIETSEETEIEIWNVTGTKSAQTKLRAGVNQIKVDYPKGAYILRISENTERDKYRTFIVK